MRRLLGRFILSFVFPAGCLLGFLCLALPAQAGETIVYPGATALPDPFRPGSNALFSPTSSDSNVMQINALHFI